VTRGDVPLDVLILDELGLPYPKARVINSAELAPKAAEGLRFPIVVKANIGGSGACGSPTARTSSEYAPAPQTDLTVLAAPAS